MIKLYKDLLEKNNKLSKEVNYISLQASEQDNIKIRKNIDRARQLVNQCAESINKIYSEHIMNELINLKLEKNHSLTPHQSYERMIKDKWLEEMPDAGSL